MLLHSRPGLKVRLDYDGSTLTTILAAAVVFTAADTNALIERAAAASAKQTVCDFQESPNRELLRKPLRIPFPRQPRVLELRLNHEQTRLEYWTEDNDSGKRVLVFRDQDPYWVNAPDKVAISQDGSFLVYSSERTGHRHLYRHDFASGNDTALTSGDWDVTQLLRLDERTSQVLFGCTIGSSLERHVCRVDLDGSRLQRITSWPGTHHIAIAHDRENKAIDTYSAANVPEMEIAFDLRRASRLPPAPEHVGFPVEFATVPTHDGEHLNASIILPASFDKDKRCPVVVFVDGAPGRQAVADRWDGWRSWWHQALASTGFVVFSVDGRGSGGRGHLFEEPVHYRLGAQEATDLLDAVEWVSRLPYVDAQHIGLWGSEYGGFLALKAAFGAVLQLKAVAALAPVTDWALQDPSFAVRYLGDASTHPGEYGKSSALEDTNRLQAKLLVAATKDDRTVPFGNIVSLKNALKKSKRPPEFAVFEGHPEGIVNPDVLRALLPRMLRFFQTNLQTEQNSPR